VRPKLAENATYYNVLFRPDQLERLRLEAARRTRREGRLISIAEVVRDAVDKLEGVAA